MTLIICKYNKKNPNIFFSCWALYYRCVKLNATFNALCLFSACHIIEVGLMELVIAHGN